MADIEESGGTISQNIDMSCMPDTPVEGGATDVKPREWTIGTSSPAAKKIVGLKDAILCPEEPGNPACAVSIFDTTTDIDRAYIQLYNDTGGASDVGNIAIKGKIVFKVKGSDVGKKMSDGSTTIIKVKKVGGEEKSAGYVWTYADYSDIELRGEKGYSISNDFINTPGHAETVGDWVTKELRNHDMYEVALRGFHPYLEPDDLWDLEIDHTMPGGTSQQELISVTVQIANVAYGRTPKEIGETVLTLRVPAGAWTKTTPRKAKLILPGTSTQDLSRSSVVTVAARDYAGDADYHCPGTGDETTINAALSYTANIGGGEVRLLGNNFYISQASNIITIPGNGITLRGEGPGNTNINAAINTDSSVNVIYTEYDDIMIDGISINITGTYATSINTTGIYIDHTDRASISNVYIDGPNTGIEGTGNHYFTLIHSRISVSGESATPVFSAGAESIIKNNVFTIASSLYAYGIGGIYNDCTISENIFTIIGDDIEYIRVFDLEAAYNSSVSKNYVTTSGTFAINTESSIFGGVWPSGLNAVEYNGNIITIGGTWDIDGLTAGFTVFDVQGSNSRYIGNSIKFNGTFTLASGDIVRGIFINATSQKCVVSNTMISFAGTWSCAGSVYGIYCSGNYNNIASNNITGVNFNGAADSTGIYLSGDDCNINNNQVWAFTNTGAGRGIGHWTTSAVSGENMTGNTYQGCEVNWDNDGSVPGQVGNRYT